jgi:hypothetical protein
LKVKLSTIPEVRASGFRRIMRLSKLKNQALLTGNLKLFDAVFYLFKQYGDIDADYVMCDSFHKNFVDGTLYNAKEDKKLVYIECVENVCYIFTFKPKKWFQFWRK